VVPHHFVRRQVVDWDQPERIAAALAAQIEARFPELRDPAAKPEGRLIELLGRVSKRLGPSGDLVLLVDGLDETRADPGDNPLPRFLPHEVPMGIRLLCAMRSTYPHLSWIEARSPARRIDLDARQWAASNDAVVRRFWEAVAAEYRPPLPPETRITAIERAEGNVLHAVMLHDALRGLPPPERRGAWSRRLMTKRSRSGASTPTFPSSPIEPMPATPRSLRPHPPSSLATLPAPSGSSIGRRRIAARAHLAAAPTTTTNAAPLGATSLLRRSHQYQ
jgi:hypothetical protein